MSELSLQLCFHRKVPFFERGKPERRRKHPGIAPEQERTQTQKRQRRIREKALPRFESTANPPNRLPI